MTLKPITKITQPKVTALHRQAMVLHHLQPTHTHLRTPPHVRLTLGDGVGNET